MRMFARGLGAGVLLSCVVAAAIPGSAIAQPQWFECAKAPKNEQGEYTGGFGDKACAVVQAHGRYVLQAGVGKGKAFKGKSGVARFHLTTPLEDNTYECPSGKVEGFAIPPYRVNRVRITYKGCGGAGGTEGICTSPGAAKAGEIFYGPMAGTLNYVNGPGKLVGLDLNREGEPGGTLGEVTCGSTRLTIKGSVIGEPSGDINAINKEFKITFATGPFVGEVEYNGRRWTPQINTPRFEGFPDDYELAMACGPLVVQEFLESCASSIPAGVDQVLTSKGEPLEIKA